MKDAFGKTKMKGKMPLDLLLKQKPKMLCSHAVNITLNIRCILLVTSFSSNVIISLKVVLSIEVFKFDTLTCCKTVVFK